MEHNSDPRTGQPFNPYRLFNGIFIPEALVRFNRVSPGAKLAYGQLARHAGANGRCFPKQTTLANKLGVADRQVRTYLTELRDQGFISISQKGLRKPNEYTFLWHPIFNGTDRKDSSGQDRKPGSAPHRKDSSGPNTRESVEKSQFEQSQPSSSTALDSRSSPPPTPSPSTGERAKQLSSTRIDDDDHEHGGIQYKSEREELIALIEKATGQAPDCKLIDDIQDRLKLREISVHDYLDEVRPRLRRLKRRAGPGFFYSLASEPGRSTPSAPLEQRQHPRRCRRCAGIGKTPEGEYCDCPMGRDLARVDKPPVRKKPIPNQAPIGDSAIGIAGGH